MELINTFSLCFIVILLLSQDSAGFDLFPFTSSEKAVLGNNVFTLSCNYTLAQNEILFFIKLSKQRDGETEKDLILFTESANESYSDESLRSRTDVTRPTSSSRRISVQFNDIVCQDKATYKWTAAYSIGASTNETTKQSIVPVMAVTTFAEKVAPSFAPSSNLMEGDNVTFTCTGDVGAEPVGTFKWYYFLDGSPVRYEIPNPTIGDNLPYNDTSCSYTGTSSVVLQMTKQLNRFVVRCVVEQEQVERYRQTNNIPVQYQPEKPMVSRDPPNREVYYTGEESLNLTCSADANPPANFYWIVPDGNTTRVVDGPVLRFTDLMENMTGDYVCVAYNTIKFVNYTQNVTASIEVSMTTTTSTTTTTTRITTGPSGNGNPAPSSDKDDDGGTNAAIIAGPIIAGLVVITIIVIVVILVKQGKCKRKPEIEEPPEKPRNNKPPSYYGNRPDLVTSELKNNQNNQNNLNSSFTNSYDSSSDIKPRNEDGLNYIDLQFDDKPRSRRPIQVLDLERTGYAELDLPRV